MVKVRFHDDDIYTFSAAERQHIEGIAVATGAAVRAHIPLADAAPLTVAASHDVLPTGDNAFTDPAGIMWWWVDPRRDIEAVAASHLSAALAHEAFHLTRFVQLPDEAGNPSLINIAINEGLATAFARDLTGIHDPWTDYDAAQAAAWFRELQALPNLPAEELLHWKFRHPDGREWIAFRAGTWLVDRCRAVDGRTAADLVHTPAGQILTAANHPT